MFVFQLPEIGEGVIEGEVVRWLVHEGEVVSPDQPVAEIMTDKATVEISTPRGGRVVRLHASEGDVIKVHAPLVDIDDDANGEPLAPSEPATAPPAPTPAHAPTPAATPAPPPKATPAPTPPTGGDAAPAPGGRPLATPAVRRHAREAGVDLSTVRGTGRGGRITHADIEASLAAPPPKAPPAVPQVAAVSSGHEERIRIIGLRRRIADQMVRAKQVAPHFTYVDEVDATELVRWRERLKPVAAERGVRLTYIPFIMKALCLVFREFPNLNAVTEEDPFTLVVKGDVNIGVATDTPQGLYVPVVRNVDQKPLLQVAAELQDLVERTRAGRASREELTGGTFTITSVGNIGGVFATPIINVPEVAILGVNRIVDRPVVRDGQIVVRKVLYLSPSFDHRVIDGAVGARFVAALRDLLERPERMLLELR